MFREKIENTFQILANAGITRNFLYSKAETPNSFNIPIDEIVKKLDIKVEKIKDLKDEKYGFLISGVSCAKKRLIKINSSEIEQRQLFTFGHELYHILNNQSMNRDDNAGYEDKVANGFSAEFLMPYEYLLKIYCKKNGNLKAIADYFKVSVQALGYKLLNDGIVSSL